MSSSALSVRPLISQAISGKLVLSCPFRKGHFCLSNSMKAAHVLCRSSLAALQATLLCKLLLGRIHDPLKMQYYWHLRAMFWKILHDGYSGDMMALFQVASELFLSI